MEGKYFRAAALTVQEEATPPTVSAIGEHEIANYIVQCARRYGVPVVERAELCDAVAELDVDDTVPPELFEIAASALIEAGVLIKRSEQAR